MSGWKFLAVQESSIYRLIALAAFRPIRVDEHVEARIGDHACIGEIRRLGSNEIFV